MKRDLNKLSNTEFDLLIIGGGIYGATTAWEAASRGLTVALIDKGDFACATSSNSHKIIHGGIRYLQHADIGRVLESIRELNILMKIAPHLVHPMAFMMPTYGHIVKGPEIFALALLLYKIVGFNANHKTGKLQNNIKGKIVSRDECVELFPGVNKTNLTGGGIWIDGQVYNTERLLMSFMESAYNKGACLANYVEMTEFIEASNSIIGINATDKLTGREYEIKSKIIANTSGPWVDTILSKYTSRPIKLNRKFSSALNLVTKPLVKGCGIAIKSKHEDDESIINKGGRMYILAPWHNCTLVGTSQKFYDGNPDEFKITEDDIKSFLDDINLACPSLSLRRDDVLSYHAGLLPQRRKQTGSVDVKVEKKYEIIDHEKQNEVKGLISVVGVKYTTARDVSKKVVDLVCKRLGLKGRASITHYTPISGGNIKDLRSSLDSLVKNKPLGLDGDICKHLFFSYGSRVDLIMAMIEKRRELGRRLTKNLPVIEAEIAYCLEYGMVCNLEDIIFRRTDLASLGNPSDEVLLRVAEMVSEYHKCGNSQIHKEVESVKRRFAVLQ